MSLGISQFYILSPRGDVIIRKDYLGDVPRSSSEVFFRNAKFWKEGDGEAPPVFNVDGVTYLHIKEGGVQLVATTRGNLSPSFVLEFLRRICAIIKDYCGFLSGGQLAARGGGASRCGSHRVPLRAYTHGSAGSGAIPATAALTGGTHACTQSSIAWQSTIHAYPHCVRRGCHSKERGAGV